MLLHRSLDVADIIRQGDLIGFLREQAECLFFAVSSGLQQYYRTGDSMGKREVLFIAVPAEFSYPADLACLPGRTGA